MKEDNKTPTQENPNPSQWDPINEMCLNLVYCLAGAIVCETVPRVDVFSHHAILSQQASHIVANMPSKQAFVNGFLSYVYPKESSNNTSKCPPFFVDLWDREKPNIKYSNNK